MNVRINAGGSRGVGIVKLVGCDVYIYYCV